MTRALLLVLALSCAGAGHGHDAGIGDTGGGQDAPVDTDLGRPPWSRDWDAAPAVLLLDAVKDLWVVGDVHGDFERLLALMAAAGLVDKTSTPAQAVWKAGAATVVFVGDLIDKWPHGLDVIAFVQSLSASAAEAGGRVVVVMGNHEARFLAWPDDPVVEDFKKELVAALLDPVEVASGKAGPGQFLRNLPIAVRVGDTFIVHAGNTKGRTLDALVAEIKAGVDAAGFGAPVLLADDSILETPLNPRPWWELPSYDPESVLRVWAKALGAERIVQGHDPGKVHFSDGKVRADGELYQRFGRIFLVDTGMSRGIPNGTRGALLHLHRDEASGKLTAVGVDADGRTWPLWSGT